MSEPNNSHYTSPAKRVAEAPATPTMGSPKRRILYTTKWSPYEGDVSVENSRELVGAAIEAKHGAEARPFHSTTAQDFQATIKQVQSDGKVVHFTRAPLSPVRRNADITPTRISGRNDDDEDPFTDTYDVLQQLKELRLNQERLQDHAAATDARNLASDGRIAQLEGERDASNARIAQLEQELEQERDTSAARIAQLEGELDASNARIAQLEQERDNIQSELDKLELVNKRYTTLKDLYRSGYTLTLIAACNRIVKNARLAKNAAHDTGGRGKKKSPSPKKSRVTPTQPNPPSDAHIQHRERATTLARLQRNTGCQLTNLIRFASDTDNTEERVQHAHLETNLSGLLKALDALLKVTDEGTHDNDSQSYTIHQLALEARNGLIWSEEEAEWTRLPLADIPQWYTTRDRQVPAEFANQDTERPGF